MNPFNLVLTKEFFATQFIENLKTFVRCCRHSVRVYVLAALAEIENLLESRFRNTNQSKFYTKDCFFTHC
jgi:hypothetical protein